MTTQFSPRRLSTLVNDVEAWGARVDSERGMTFEIEDETLLIENPRDRVTTEEWRKMNIGFAITDALQQIVGDDSLEPLTQFVPGFARFSSNGKTIDGAYGKRFYMNEQLEMLIKLLKKTPSTRRAVLTIYMGPIDLAGGGGLNTPCTLSIHFLVRQGLLNMKVMMRSNDVILGLTNDVFTFSMLHEYVSSQTGIPMGHYAHFASSLHFYEEDAKKYIAKPDGLWPSVMNVMPSEWNPVPLYYELARISKHSFVECLAKDFTQPYDRDLYMAAALVYHRREPNAYLMWQEIGDQTLKRVAGFWIGR